MRRLSVDRVGLGWRAELAGSILSHLDEIDVVEVLIEDYLDAPRKSRDALAFLSRQVPVVYHGVSLGLASAHPVERKRLDRIARVIEKLRIERWSEHLAFVRAGGIEIGHLAAAPRTLATIEGTCRNLDRVFQAIGCLPALENIATLIDPPGSKMTEPEWIEAILARSSADLLLDLHNLWCNARNAGLDAERFLLRFPLTRTTRVHLSGGHLIHEPAQYARYAGSTRLLDDHLHPVPQGVIALLTRLAARAAQPLTVILERDGNYPRFEHLLGEIRAARAALARGRAQINDKVVDECA
jgi:uncharacterized protein (UPF0276 family)